MFVEVKYRRSGQQGSALQAVGYPKNSARSQKWLPGILPHRRLGFDTSCRFDVVAFDGDEVTWIPDAFEACF